MGDIMMEQTEIEGGIDPHIYKIGNVTWIAKTEIQKCLTFSFVCFAFKLVLPWT